MGRSHKLNGRPASKMERKFSNKRRASRLQPELWKFQWPIVGDHVMVYNEGQKQRILLETSLPGLQGLFQGGLKFFAWATYDPITQNFSFDRNRAFIYEDGEEEWPSW